MGHTEVDRMTEQCQAINLRGTQCAKRGLFDGLCVIHYQKKLRYKVELVQ